MRCSPSMTENTGGGISAWRAILLLVSVVAVAVVCIAVMHGEAEVSVLEEETDQLGMQTSRSINAEASGNGDTASDHRGHITLMQDTSRFHFWPGIGDSYAKKHPNQDPKKAVAALKNAASKLQTKVVAQAKANASSSVVTASTFGNVHYNTTKKGGSGTQGSQRKTLLEKWLGIKVAAQAARKNAKVANEVKKKKATKAKDEKKSKESEARDEKKAKESAAKTEKKGKKSQESSKKNATKNEKKAKESAAKTEKKGKKSQESSKKKSAKSFQEKHDKALAMEVKQKKAGKAKLNAEEKATKEGALKAKKAAAENASKAEKTKAAKEKAAKEAESKAVAKAKKAPCPKAKATEKATKLQLKNAEERVSKNSKSAEAKPEKSAKEAQEKMTAHKQKVLSQGRLGHYWPWERRKKATLRSDRARLGIDVSKRQVLARHQRKVRSLDAEQHEKLAAMEVRRAAKAQATDEVNSKLAARQQIILKREMSQPGTITVNPADDMLFEEQQHSTQSQGAERKPINLLHTPTAAEMKAQADAVQKDHEQLAVEQKDAALASLKMRDVLQDAKGKVATAEALRQDLATHNHLSKAEEEKYSIANAAMAKAMSTVKETALRALHLQNKETVDMKHAAKQQFILSQMRSAAKEVAEDAVADSVHKRYVGQIAGMATEMLNFKTKAQHDADKRVILARDAEQQASHDMQISDPLVQSVLAAKKLYLHAKARYSATVSEAQAAMQVLQAAQINERDSDATSGQLLSDVKRLGGAVHAAQLSLKGVETKMEKAQERAEHLRDLYLRASNAVQSARANPISGPITAQSIAQEVARQQALSKIYARKQLQQHENVAAAAERQVEWRRIANHAVHQAQENQDQENTGWVGLEGEAEQISAHKNKGNKDDELLKALPELADRSMGHDDKSELHTDEGGYVLPEKLAHELGPVMKKAEQSAWSQSALPKSTLRRFESNDPLDPMGSEHKQGTYHVNP